MNDKEKTGYTKKKLRLMFSVIVFFIIFILSLFYSSLMYFWLNYGQNKMFSSVVKSIEEKKVTLDMISYMWENTKNDDKNLNLNLSYIIVKNNKIIKKYLSYNFSDSEIKYITSYEWKEIFRYKNYISKYIYLDKEKTYIIDRVPYTLKNLFRDILVFFIISLFSSWIFFMLLWRFINKLFIPVENNISNMNTFIHNAWHELQTPLSVIVSNIDFYIKNDKKDDFILIEIKDEAKKMWELIKTLFRISKEDYKITTEYFNIFNFIQENLILFEEKIKAKNIKIILEVDEDISINANKNHLFICIANILWNAIKYNVDNWIIKINFNDNIFTIEDSWIWIEKENLDKIFDRFYKEDKSRNTEGFWIWLSLVKKLTDLNNRKIEVKSEKDIWSSFIIFI